MRTNRLALLLVGMGVVGCSGVNVAGEGGGSGGAGGGSGGAGGGASAGGDLPCDVAATVQNHCLQCHSAVPSGGATFSMLSRADFSAMSPIDGTILVRVSEPGEGLSPGVPAVVIGNPNDVWIKLYISDRDIGRVVLGQKTEISIDSFPDKRFSGRVTFISPKAEFTPKNIQTKEERITQMFAVKVTVDKPDGVLKPGIPADCDL